jgi:hypothetical protein
MALSACRSLQSVKQAFRGARLIAPADKRTGRTMVETQRIVEWQQRLVHIPSVGPSPLDGECVDGKASTEIRFNVYEDGATAGSIQRDKGRFVEGHNVSIETAMLLQAYLAHVIRQARMEFASGVQDKKSLDQLFQ